MASFIKFIVFIEDEYKEISFIVNNNLLNEIIELYVSKKMHHYLFNGIHVLSSDKMLKNDYKVYYNNIYVINKINYINNVILKYLEK